MAGGPLVGPMVAGATSITWSRCLLSTTSLLVSIFHDVLKCGRWRYSAWWWILHFHHHFPHALESVLRLVWSKIVEKFWIATRPWGYPWYESVAADLLTVFSYLLWSVLYMCTILRIRWLSGFVSPVNTNRKQILVWKRLLVFGSVSREQMDSNIWTQIENR